MPEPTFPPYPMVFKTSTLTVVTPSLNHRERASIRRLYKALRLQTGTSPLDSKGTIVRLINGAAPEPCRVVPRFAYDPLSRLPTLPACRYRRGIRW